MPSVLFICTANRFRSPLASAFFRSALGDAAGTDWKVDSAGTWTSTGMQVLPEVALTARKYGLDLTRHRSKPVTEALLSSHDLILVMEAGHKEALEQEFPSSSGRIHLLSQVVEDRTYDIPDSFDSLESVMEIGEDLYELIRNGYKNICKLTIQLQKAR